MSEDQLKKAEEEEKKKKRAAAAKRRRRRKTRSRRSEVRVSVRGRDWLALNGQKGP